MQYPTFEWRMSYVQLSAGYYHTVLLRSDGSAVACGVNNSGQCSIPALDEGVSYIHISPNELIQCFSEAMAAQLPADGMMLDNAIYQAWMREWPTPTFLKNGFILRSDGCAVSCGRNDEGQCNIPPLEEGMCYTQVSAEGYHTVLLRSDGSAVACGGNEYRQCNIPSLRSWRELLTFATARRHYVCDLIPLDKDYVVQTGVALDDDAAMLTCWDLAGHEVLYMRAKGFDLAVETSLSRMARDLKVSLQRLLSWSCLMDSCWPQFVGHIHRHHPSASWAKRR